MINQRWFLVCFAVTLLICATFLVFNWKISRSALVFLSPVISKFSDSYLSPQLIAIIDNATNSTTAEAPVAATSTTKKGGQKIILLWNGFFGDHWVSHFTDMGGNTLPGGPPELNRSCLYTIDRNLLNEASAVVFHGRDFNFGDMPPSRPTWQHWVYYLLESPVNSGFDENAWNRAAALGLDWVLGYNRKAHVWEPYCHIEPWRPSSQELSVIENRIKNFSETFAKRPKNALWFVSDCGTQSKREKLAEKMRAAGIEFDQFGRCSGKNGDGEMQSLGKEAFFSRYRYYFSFENSLCEEYFTEKFAKGIEASLLYGLIPIVYGGPGYSELTPEKAVISVTSFKSVAEMAANLQMLQDPTNKNAVLDHFKWHKTHKRGDCNFVRFGFGNLCKKLFEEHDNCGQKDLHEREGLKNYPSCKPPQPVGDLRKFLGQCQSPNIV